MLSSNSLCALFAVLASQALAGDGTTCYTAMTSKNPGGYVPTQWTTHYGKVGLHAEEGSMLT